MILSLHTVPLLSPISPISLHHVISIASYFQNKSIHEERTLIILGGSTSLVMVTVHEEFVTELPAELSQACRCSISRSQLCCKISIVEVVVWILYTERRVAEQCICSRSVIWIPRESKSALVGSIVMRLDLHLETVVHKIETIYTGGGLDVVRDGWCLLQAA